jgi:leucyl-tRNA synthetase
MGYDAFGLPAENYAIKHNVHPAKSTANNIEYIRKQLRMLGCMYDWSKEINTSSSDYYKWTQWLFEVLYEAGLAKKRMAPVNWCPSCKTVLANEQVISGECERCGTEVVQKNLRQWFFEITEYADKLLEGHKKLRWPQKTILMQKNWIGKSVGVEMNFKGIKKEYKNGAGLGKLSGREFDIPVFTTRPDTIYGVTYLVLAPEHPLVLELTSGDRKKEVENYIKKTKKLKEIERTSLERGKTGVFIGAAARNPVTGDKVPIWIADYVLLSYGTGAIMAVPAHDQRDFEFAKKFGLDIKEVVAPTNIERGIEMMRRAYEDPGILVNSGEFSGLSSREAIPDIVDYIESKGWGRRQVNYKLRDWLISRQRYWGAPIPIIYCDKCGEVLVPEKDLPVELPDIKDFMPTEKGESPLAKVDKFVNTTCPKCGGTAKRETETMDTFVCSSWYFLRFLNPKLSDKPFDKRIVEKWLPVDQYIGGAEHANAHLLYARFITKVLHDQEYIDFDEPFTRLVHQGLILAEDGSKMSKSKGNVVIPDNYMKEHGVDVFRLYILFLAPFREGGSWSDKGIAGAKRFLERVWDLGLRLLGSSKSGIKVEKNEGLEKLLHQTIKKVSDDYENFRFNTAISAMMILANEMMKLEAVFADMFKTLLILLSPIAPHITEELWERLGEKKSVFETKWPVYDSKLAKVEEVELVIQISGKVRDKIKVRAGISKNEALEMARESEKVKKYIEGKKIKKVILVKDRLLSLVV